MGVEGSFHCSRDGPAFIPSHLHQLYGVGSETQSGIRALWQYTNQRPNFELRPPVKVYYHHRYQQEKGQ